MAKDLKMCVLLDIYGDIITKKQYEVMDYYYNQDLSLGEIAAEVGISRQGVRDSIKKAEEELFFLEEHLHLRERALKMSEASERLLALPLSDEAREAAKALVEAAGLTLPS